MELMEKLRFAVTRFRVVVDSANGGRLRKQSSEKDNVE